VTSDVEFPRFDGGPPFVDLRFTDRDAILVRSDLGGREMQLSNVQHALYDTFLPILPGVNLVRGWNSVDVLFRGRAFRFVNSHLESDPEVIRLLQTQELIAGPLDTALPVVFVGDANSDANGVVDPAAYQLLRAADLEDAWAEVHAGSPGYTCCQEELLTNPTSLLDQRIDVILYRGNFDVKSADVVGEATSDRISNGSVTLWPSDHAGVVATLGVQYLRTEDGD
jgi:endonuclease/exonuclease/phosphatase family metal-dependent hydrolase